MREWPLFTFMKLVVLVFIYMQRPSTYGSTAESTSGGIPQTPFSSGPPTSGPFGRSQDPPDHPTPTTQLPASQQRQMVMPDRMRWIYRDPQGNTQGPWSGLEMHDWYKAGFFSPELQVKKLEDSVMTCEVTRIRSRDSPCSWPSRALITALPAGPSLLPIHSP